MNDPVRAILEQHLARSAELGQQAIDTVTKVAQAHVKLAERNAALRVQGDVVLPVEIDVQPPPEDVA